MANRQRLVMKSGPTVGSSFELASPIVSIGRYAGNTIAISDEQVSRHHCRLTRTAEGYTLEDLGSVNGLFVNDQRVTTPVPLKQGDKVRLGQDIVFVYEVFTEYDAIPAFAGVEPVPNGKIETVRSDLPVSDKGATVYVRAVELPASRSEPAKREQPKLSIWVWVAIGIAIIGAAVLVVVILSSTSS
jgi:FHA domain-containing protein